MGSILCFDYEQMLFMRRFGFPSPGYRAASWRSVFRDWFVIASFVVVVAFD
jgi:hypothetical protein